MVISLLLACGCRQQATPSAPARPAAAQPQQQHAPSERSDAFEHLVHATQLLTVEPVTQDAVIEALRAVAAVLLTQDAPAAAEIDALADKLAAGDAESPIAVVQEALRRARSAVEALISEEPGPNVRDAYVRTARAVDALEAGEPLRSQEQRVQTAFAALANLVAAVQGAPSVPELATTIEVGYVADRFRERIDRASSLVSDLAIARDSKRASDAAHRALRAFAEVVEVAPLAAERPHWRSLVLAIRFSALRLRGIDPISQERSDHVRAGLLASLAAIERMTRDTRLVATSRNAVERIDPHALFVFQRAAIQDAFRSHVQVFDVIARGMRGDQRSARR